MTERRGFPAARLQVSGAAFMDARELLHDRVRAYVKTLLGFFGLFSVAGLVKGLLLRDLIKPELYGSFTMGLVILVAITAGLGVTLGYLRHERPVTALGVVETIATLLTVFAVGRLLHVVPVDAAVAAPVDVAALLLTILVLVTRAAMVPSTGARTAVLGVLATAEVSVVSLLRDGALGESPVHQSIWLYVATWGLVFTAVTVVLSRTIYGLHERVRKAVQLGNYTIDAKLGEGGMGEVYLAHHALLRRPTAIKLLPPRKSGKESLARFEREVLQASRLTHPNTVEVYDFGHTPDGLFYYAMEYLDGLNLEELIHLDGPQPAGRVVYVMRQVAHALAHAHDKKLIHRDIKPANIVLCDRGGVADTAKVVDFGLVKQIEAPDDLVLTGTNTITGTPAYMAPESLTKPDAIDGRADIYALGAVAYFMLTGEPVFSGNTLVEICGHHLHTEPEPPSRRSGGAIPASLEKIVLRCLEKSPDDRFATAMELFLALEASESASMWSLERAVAWWQKHRGAVREVVQNKQESVSSSDTVFEARLSA